MARATTRSTRCSRRPVTKRLFGELARRPAEERPPPPALQDLTDREREVLGLVSQGLSSSEIAKKLFLSEGTVKTHLKAASTRWDCATVPRP